MSQHYIKQNPKIKRSIGRKTWNLISRIPLPIRGRILRSLFSVDQTLDSDIVFKRAETADEIQQAFRIAYEGFQERGLVPESDVGLRVTKFHALPTTAILIAKKKDEVIATVTLIVDSALGLPMEKLWDLAPLRKTTTRIAELSTLAIKRGYRSQRGKLLLPLSKFQYEYGLKYLGIDTFVASYHPEVQDFYRCILMFSNYDDGPPKSYDFVQGAAAVAGVLRIDDLRKAYIKAYGERPTKRNLLHYFTKTQVANFQFPARPFFKASDVTFNPAQLEYFFQNQTGILDTLKPKEKSVIANAYFHDEFASILEKHGTRELSRQNDRINRNRARFPTLCDVEMKIEGDPTTYKAVALEVSANGLMLQMKKNLVGLKNRNVTLSIQVSGDRTIPLSGTIAWNQDEVGRIGIELQKFIPQPWLKLIEHLEQDLKDYAKSSGNQPLRKA